MEPDRRRRHRRARGSRGETLLELLVAVSIMSTVVVAGLSGLTTSMKVSIDQRMSARGETLLRSAAEQLQNPDLAYIPQAGCPGLANYTVPALSTTEAGYTVSIRSVAYWTGASNNPSAAVGTAFSTTCPLTAAADKGMQKIVIEVTGPLDHTDGLTVVKRRR